MADDLPPYQRRLAGEAIAHEGEARRQIDRLARERANEAPPDTFGPGDLEERTGRIEVELQRLQQATVPDSDPPPVLSVALSPDRSVRVWDPRIAALALVLLAFVATAWLMR